MHRTCNLFVAVRILLGITGRAPCVACVSLVEKNLSQPEAHRLEKNVVCRPKDGDVWVFGTHHRTGTMLMMELLFGSQGLGGNYMNWWWNKDHQRQLLGPCEENDGFTRACAAELLSSGYSGLFYSHLRPKYDAWLDAVSSFSMIARPLIVHFVRSPVNITLSSYFYHRRLSEDNNLYRRFEPRIYEKPSTKLADFFAHCEQPEQWGLGEECKHIEHYLQPKPHNKWNVVEVEMLLPPKLGIIVEVGAGSENRRALLEAKAALLDQTPKTVFTVDLDVDVSEHYDDTFTRMFEFLGLSQLEVKACVEIAQRFDLSRHPDASYDPRHTGRATDAKLKETLRHVLLSSPYLNRTSIWALNHTSVVTLG